MNPRILNREFQHPTDGWYHIEPKGEHLNREAKLTQVIDDDACQRIVNRFNADADAGTLSHGHEMLIDHEHFRHDADKETIAYGWLQRLQNRADGIYGQVRWSATGQKAVDGGDYRFFSTEYDPKDLKVLNDRKVRPLRLDGLSLTNEPNNKGARPITNRETTLADASASAVNQNKQNQNSNRMKNIATKLGLAAEASEDAILAEVTKIMNRVTTLEPLATENTTLRTRITELDAANVDALLAGHGVKDAKVLNRMKPILVATPAADRQACLDELIPKPAATAATATAASQQTKLHNRDTRPPGTKATEEAGGQPDATKAQRIMNRAREIKTENKGVSHATAVMMAQRELEVSE